MKKYKDKCTDIYLEVIEDEYACSVLQEKEGTIHILTIILEDMSKEVGYYKRLLYLYSFVVIICQLIFVIIIVT